MATPRILTFNFHEPYLCLMAETGLPLDVGVYEHGPLARAWHAQFRCQVGASDQQCIDARHGGDLVHVVAALDRLDRHPEVVDPIDVDVMVPQVGQAALAIECRADANTPRLSRLAEPVANCHAAGAGVQ